MTNKCISCEEVKTMECFGSHFDKRSGKTRVRNECKEFRSIRESIRNKENPEKRVIYTKKWRDSNKDSIREYERNRHNHKRKEDPQFRIKNDIISHMRHFINGERKTLDILNCTREQFHHWFEFMFYDNMSWETKNWTEDHVVPLSFFDLTDAKELQMACHWSNVRPTTEHDNRIKSNKIERITIMNHIDRVKEFLRTNNSYQTSMETCWWQRVELWNGKNAQDDKDFIDLLKWAIRSEDPKPE